MGRGMFRISPIGQFFHSVECRYHCDVVDNVGGGHGCFLDGSAYTGDTPPQCADPNHVLCPGENSCYRASTLTAVHSPVSYPSFSPPAAGYECYRNDYHSPASPPSLPSTTASFPSLIIEDLPKMAMTHTLPTHTLAAATIIEYSPTIIFSFLSTTIKYSQTTATTSTSTPRSCHGGSSDGSPDGSGTPSSALSIPVNPLLTVFAAVGMSTYFL